jgi:hypothetical protein
MITYYLLIGLAALILPIISPDRTDGKARKEMEKEIQNAGKVFGPWLGSLIVAIAACILGSYIVLFWPIVMARYIVKQLKKKNRNEDLNDDKS